MDGVTRPRLDEGYGQAPTVIMMGDKIRPSDRSTPRQPVAAPNDATGLFLPLGEQLDPLRRTAAKRATTSEGNCPERGPAGGTGGREKDSVEHRRAAVARSEVRARARDRKRVRTGGQAHGQGRERVGNQGVTAELTAERSERSPVNRDVQCAHDIPLQPHLPETPAGQLEREPHRAGAAHQDALSRARPAGRTVEAQARERHGEDLWRERSDQAS